jgi:hypothetical protein
MKTKTQKGSRLIKWFKTVREKNQRRGYKHGLT